MTHSLKEIIAIANNKGGVGKTTSVQSIAACLKRLYNAKVLVIDIDPQVSLSNLLGWTSYQEQHSGEKLRTVYDAMINGGSSLPVYKTDRGIYYVPGSFAMQDIDTDLLRQLQPNMILKECFESPLDNHTDDTEIKTVMDFDYIFIDCPPALSHCTINALSVATGVIIPVQMEGMSVTGLSAILTQVKMVKKALNPNLEIRGLLRVMVDNRTKLAQSVIDYFEENYKEILIDAMVKRSIKINEAQQQDNYSDIFDYAPYSPAGIGYEMVTKELFAEDNK